MLNKEIIKKYVNYILILLFVILVIFFSIYYINTVNKKSQKKNIDLEKLDTPIIVLDTVATDNSITVNLNVATLSDTYKIEKFVISIGNDMNKFDTNKKEIVESNSNSQTIEFLNLKEDTAYYIKAEVTYKSKTYNKISEKVVTLENKSTNYTEYKNFAFLFKKNVVNENNGKKIKDLTPPSFAKIAMPNEVYVNQQFDVNISHQDSLSGIDLNECKYIFSTQKIGYGVNSVKWKSADKFNSQNQVISLKASSEGIYYLHVLSKDMFKNWRETTRSIKVVENLGNGTRDKKLSKYNIPYIPKNFKYLEGNVNNGFVIIDKNNGNEFVWVPVDNNNIKFERLSFDKYYYKTFANYTESMDKNIEQSIKKYGGFYIARFESGIDKTNGNNIGIPVSRKNTKVWTYISKNNALISSQNMYNDKEIKSILMSSYIYDTTLKWILNSNNIDGKDSYLYGNYKNSKDVISIGEILTGQNENWKLNNIYDLAGNAWEWTSETFMNSFSVKRGGSYLENGIDAPVIYRDTSSDEHVSNNISFRVALYII